MMINKLHPIGRLALTFSVVFVHIGVIWFLLGHRLLDVLTESYPALGPYRGFIIGTGTALLGVGIASVIMTREWKQREKVTRQKSEAERFIAKFINLTDEAIVVMDHDHRILMANPRVQSMFGYVPDELIGKPLNPLLREAQIELTGEPVSLNDVPLDYVGRHEVCVLRKDGSRVSTDISITGIDFMGKQALLFAIRDVSEAKNALQALEENELRYRLLADGATDMISQYDMDGRYLYVSPSCERLLGYEPDELIGQSAYAFYHPDDASTVDTSRRTILKNEDLVYTAVHRVRHKDGSYIWFETTSHTIPKPEYGTTPTIVAVSRNVTDRVQVLNALEESEARYRLLAENATDMISEHDDNGHFMYVSPACRRLLGYEPEELVGQDIYTLYHPQDIDEMDDAYAEFIEDDELVYTFSIRMKHKQGHYVWVEVTNRTFHRHSDSGSAGVISITRDISRRKQLEESLIKALQSEKELVDLKLHFTTTVSHEFRTPLAIIMSSADMLKQYHDRLDEGKKQAHIDKIFRQTQHMRHLLDDSMFLSKAQAGMIRLAPVTLDIEEFCRSLFEEMKNLATEKHEMVFEAAENLPSVYLDERLIQQIVANLLSNAIKYSPQGGRIVMCLYAEGDQIVITISDEGIGIPEPDHHRIFDAFHRAENTGAIQGTGLGTSIIKTSVDLFKGSIEMKSEVNKGSTFIVRLPQKIAAHRAEVTDTARFIAPGSDNL